MLPLDASRLEAQLRSAVGAAVERTSLRGVARAVGLSPTGLGKFLTGSKPYPATRRKLERWFAAQARSTRGALAGGDALHVVRVLLHDLPPDAQPAAQERLLATLESVYAASRGGAPDWLRSLRSGLPRA
ncbi:MAG: hypothetical protein JWM27_4985 [Gemmatimonadetes bacterium]|nr:hypothetical protein [Gemmatimonadota bacterium]